jgi:hypothetical protein
MPTAVDVLIKTYTRYMTNWAVIVSLRQVTDEGLPHAEKAIAKRQVAALEWMTDRPELLQIFEGNGISVGKRNKALLRDTMTNTRAAVDAASLVFAHSILDDCAWSFCRVCALANPHDWEYLIDTRKIDFATLREKTADTIREELIGARLNQLERESLLTKVDLLFRLCPPPKAFAPIRNYSFDRDRLERIDGDRHRIIHSGGFTGNLMTIDEDLDFVSTTVLYLMALVEQKYHLTPGALTILRVENELRRP